MRKVKYTDLQGYKHVVLVKDGDPDEAAAKGLPENPSLDDFDWEAFKRDLNNLLVDEQVFNWLDYQRNASGVQQAVNLFKRRLLNFYRYRNGNGPQG